MLDAVIDYLRNDFRVRKACGTFAIDGGRLDVPELAIPEGAYIRIFGSVFNDGLHLYGDDDLNDETFDGTVWLLAIPTELLQIVSRIEADMAASTAGTNGGGPMKSESFDGYSYTRMTRADGSIMDWRDLYRDRLARWRKI
jgi:hypothetical protein